MKIVAVSTIREEPWIGQTLTHLRNQGVDDILISVEDRHAYRLAVSAGAKVFGVELPFDQGAEITKLAQIAVEEGADWIIPFDADEYWCGTHGETIRQALNKIPAEVNTTYASMYLHITPERRVTVPKPLPKVAFRSRDNMTVAWGSHDVTGIDGIGVHFVEVRELQYRSYTHFLTKIEKARTLHTQPHMAGHQHGSHMWRLVEMTAEQRREEWAQHLAAPTVVDPIPGSDQWTIG